MDPNNVETVMQQHLVMTLIAALLPAVIRTMKDDVTFLPTWASGWRLAIIGALSIVAAAVEGFQQDGSLKNAFVAAFVAGGPALLIEIIHITQNKKDGGSGNASSGGPMGSRKAQPSAYSTKCVRFALAGATMLLALSCTDCKRSDGTPINWGKAVQCAPEAGNLIGDVTEILINKAAPGATVLSQTGKDELARLAVQHGASAVICAVETLWRDWSNPTMAAVAPYRKLGAARARDFLDSTGATVERDQ